MDVRILQYFVTVAQEKNLTHAAQKLHMNQPPLSYQMRQLENVLGVTLFHRSPHGLTLTPEGEVLYRRAEEIIEMGNKAIAEVQAVRENLAGKLYLSVAEGSSSYIAAAGIASFREKYPRVTFHLWNAMSDEGLERLYNGLADLALIAAPYDSERLEGIAVGKKPWVAAFSSHHPLAATAEQEIPLASLAGVPLTVPARKARIEYLRQWFSEAGLEPNILCEVTSYEDSIALAASGAAVSIMPQPYIAPIKDIITRVIVQPTHYAEYVLAWERKKPLTGLASEFASHMEKQLYQETHAEIIQSS